jgi:hypothetical protein
LVRSRAAATVCSAAQLRLLADHGRDDGAGGAGVTKQQAAAGVNMAHPNVVNLLYPKGKDHLFPACAGVNRLVESHLQ